MSNLRHHQTPAEETLDRTRRIETRLTQLMIGLGISTKAAKPVFDPAANAIHIPSMHSSLQEILDSVPEGWQGSIRIGSRVVANITRPVSN